MRLAAHSTVFRGAVRKCEVNIRLVMSRRLACHGERRVQKPRLPALVARLLRAFYSLRVLFRDAIFRPRRIVSCCFSYLDAAALDAHLYQFLLCCRSDRRRVCFLAIRANEAGYFPPGAPCGSATWPVALSRPQIPRYSPRIRPFLSAVPGYFSARRGFGHLSEGASRTLWQSFPVSSSRAIQFFQRSQQMPWDRIRPCPGTGAPACPLPFR